MKYRLTDHYHDDLKRMNSESMDMLDNPARLLSKGSEDCNPAIIILKDSADIVHAIYFDGTKFEAEEH
jgi:hypothetical protein